MGLFSFLKNAGAKIFGGSSAPAPTAADNAEIVNKQREDLMVKMVNTMGLAVTNLAVNVDGDTVVVYGDANTQAIKEKVILALGNVEGIGSVDDRMTVTNPEPESKFHTVEKGESLSKIAKEYYGDPMKYPMIFEANKPMLTDPDLIYPGQVLRIPAIA
jgi:nucleoid-associated protein YgaU